jgi:hypothetical protein
MRLNAVYWSIYLFVSLHSSQIMAVAPFSVQSQASQDILLFSLGLHHVLLPPCQSRENVVSPVTKLKRIHVNVCLIILVTIGDLVDVDVDPVLFDGTQGLVNCLALHNASGKTDRAKLESPSDGAGLSLLLVVRFDLQVGPCVAAKKIVRSLDRVYLKLGLQRLEALKCDSVVAEDRDDI